MRANLSSICSSTIPRTFTRRCIPRTRTGRALVNFALLHIFGYQFAPRYKAIQEKLRTSLYGFEHPTQYGEILLKPVRKLHTDLIVEEWENLQRIFVSLALKTTSAVHHRPQTQLLCSKKQDTPGFVGIRQYHQQPVLARLRRFTAPAQKRPDCAQSWRKLPSTSSCRFLCQFWQIALQIRRGPLSVA